MNKMVKIGTLCLALVLGLVFVGCEDFQKVEFGSIGKPGNVAASYASSTLTVTWDAVDGAKSYDIIASQDGKKGFIKITENFAPSTALSDLNRVENKISSGLPSGTYKIGVIANSRRTDKNSSSPGWSAGTVTLP